MDPSMQTISQNFHNFVEIVGPGFKTLAEATAHEVAHDEAREKPFEAREKAHEVAQAKFAERKTLLSQVIFEIEGLSDDEAMFILQVFLLLTIHF